MVKSVEDLTKKEWNKIKKKEYKLNKPILYISTLSLGILAPNLSLIYPIYVGIRMISNKK